MNFIDLSHICNITTLRAKSSGSRMVQDSMKIQCFSGHPVSFHCMYQIPNGVGRRKIMYFIFKIFCNVRVGRGRYGVVLF